MQTQDEIRAEIRTKLYELYMSSKAIHDENLSDAILIATNLAQHDRPSTLVATGLSMIVTRRLQKLCDKMDKEKYL